MFPGKSERMGGAVLPLLLLMVACSTPPRGRTAPATSTQEAAPIPEVQDTRYELEREQEFPDPATDVEFEEDSLPPAPEDLPSATLDSDSVNPEPVGERGDVVDLPAPTGDEVGTAGIEPTVTTPVPPTVSTPVEPGASARVVRGFRVQLFAVSDRTDARKGAEEASQRLGLPVYVVSEPPHYKVRAGDFTDRGDAVRLKERAVSLGYDGCWVVTDQIQLQK